jgi:hypothetical protein
MAKIRLKDGPLDDDMPHSAHGKVILRDGRVGYVTEMTTDQSGPFLKASITAVFVTAPATGRKRRVSALEANFGQATKAAEKMAKAFGLNTAFVDQVLQRTPEEKLTTFKNERLATPHTSVGPLRDPRDIPAFKRKTFELEERICDLKLERDYTKRSHTYDEARRGFWVTLDRGENRGAKEFVSDWDLDRMETELDARKRVLTQAEGLPF